MSEMAITKSEMVRRIAARTGVKNHEVEAVVEVYGSEILRLLKKDDTFNMPGLGKFKPVIKRERMYTMPVGPRKGELMKSAAHMSVKFRLGASEKKLLNT